MVSDDDSNLDEQHQYSWESCENTGKSPTPEQVQGQFHPVEDPQMFHSAVVILPEERRDIRHPPPWKHQYQTDQQNVMPYFARLSTMSAPLPPPGCGSFVNYDPPGRAFGTASFLNPLHPTTVEGINDQTTTALGLATSISFQDTNHFLDNLLPDSLSSRMWPDGIEQQVLWAPLASDFQFNNARPVTQTAMGHDMSFLHPYQQNQYSTQALLHTQAMLLHQQQQQNRHFSFGTGISNPNVYHSAIPSMNAAGIKLQTADFSALPVATITSRPLALHQDNGPVEKPSRPLTAYNLFL
jgi:hypothetical protein